MGIKLGKNGKLPGDTLIGTGIIFCFLSVLLFVLTSLNGVPNGLIFSGGGILGLLIICVGYLKRISAALIASSQIEAAAPVAKL
jgi:succinate-acetate transporter protein